MERSVLASLRWIVRQYPVHRDSIPTAIQGELLRLRLVDIAEDYLNPTAAGIEAYLHEEAEEAKT